MKPDPVAFPSALLPCPFCNSENLDARSGIECRDCGCFGPSRPLKVTDLPTVVSRWNQRGGVDAPSIEPDLCEVSVEQFAAALPKQPKPFYLNPVIITCDRCGVVAEECEGLMCLRNECGGIYRYRRVAQ